MGYLRRPNCINSVTGYPLVLRKLESAGKKTIAGVSRVYNATVQSSHLAARYL